MAALLLLILLCTNNVSAKEYYTIEEMQQTIAEYEKIIPEYGKKDMFSEEVWKRHGLLVTKENALKSQFNTKHIIKKGERQNNVTRYNNNSYSFLGTTPEEYLVENPDYPADAGKILQFENFNWTQNLNDETRMKRFWNQMMFQEKLCIQI